MAATGGSIESLVLKGRRFSIAADADSNRKLGGFENTVETNGDGTSRLLKVRTSWMLDGLSVSIDDSLSDLEYLQDLANTNEFFTCLITYASGLRYEGQGQLTEEVQAASNNTVAAIKLGGTGLLTRQ